MRSRGIARTAVRRALVVSAASLAFVGGSVSGGENRPVEWSRLSSEAQRLIEPVVINPQIAREVGDIRYPSRPEVANYLLDYPDFAADVARVLREGKYRVRRTGAQYEADDGRGVTGIMKPLFAENGRRIFYLQGRYDTHWLPTLYGRAVLVLDTEHTSGATGAPQADVRVTGYLRIDSRLASSLLMIARDFSERTVDRKVRRFFGHVERISRRACDDPRGLADLLAGRSELSPERVAEFRRILLDQRATRLGVSDGGQTPTPPRSASKITAVRAPALPAQSTRGEGPSEWLGRGGSIDRAGYMPSAARASSITGSVIVV